MEHNEYQEDSAEQEIPLEEQASILQDPSKAITKRFRCLFEIRGIGTFEAVKALIEAFRKEQKSDLLKHEICYCLGQMNTTQENTECIHEFFEKVITEDHSSIVIHEAVEGYANLNPDNITKLLKKFEGIDDELVNETCELALELKKWNEETNFGETEGLNLKSLKHWTNDPAPPYNQEKNDHFKSVDWLKSLLLDPTKPIFERYRAMFTLREIGTDEACEALCQSLTKENFSTCSALLKHEIGFVLGQLGHTYAKVWVPYLEQAVQNEEEAPVVRHEWVIALGDITDKTETMEKYSEDKDDIVRESWLVAHDMVNFWKE
jgi:deoxyhypusine monooxygenase